MHHYEYQVRVTRIYTVLTSKRSPQTPTFFLQLYIIASIVLIHELSWDCAALPCHSYRYCQSFLQFIPDPVSSFNSTNVHLGVELPM